MSTHCQTKWFVPYLFVVFLFLSDSAFAWRLSLANVEGNLVQGQYYSMTVAFEGGPTDYLDFLSFAIEWDTSLLQLSSFVDVESYMRNPGFPDPAYQLWGPTFVSPTPDIPNGKYYDINAETHLAHMGEFFPEATNETLMATLSFTALKTGLFTDMASFYFTPESNLTELVQINGTNYTAEDGQLRYYKDGTRSVLAPLLFIAEDIETQTTNVATQTDPIPLIFTPTSDTAVTFSASSSNANLVRPAQVIFAADANGTGLPSPFNVQSGDQRTVYLFITPEAGRQGTATLTITLSGSGGTASTSFDITVELAEATLDFFDGKTTYRKSSPVTLSGEKARGSQIFLWIGGDDPFEIVSTTVDGDWSYDWNITTDGVYNFSLINRAGTVEETFATGTMVLDTLAPQVPISRRTLTGVSFNSGQPGVHQISMRAEAPSGADSDRFMFCLDGEKNGSPKSYGEVNVITGGAVDGTPHQVAAIPVDAAGNQQAGCNGKPVAWSLSADRTQISNFAVSLVEPAAGPAYVELKWPVDPGSPSSPEVRVWAKSRAGDAYKELPGPPVADAYGNWWIFNDPASPARIRSYLLTDASGTVTLVEFERLDDPRSKSANPMAPILLLLLNDS